MWITVPTLSYLLLYSSGAKLAAFDYYGINGFIFVPTEPSLPILLRIIIFGFDLCQYFVLLMIAIQFLFTGFLFF